MYHHHILQQDKTETIRQIYEKQKTDYTKGDWFQLLIKDFEFIEETMDEEQIKNMSKIQYKKKIKDMVKKAAFKYLTKQKEEHKKVKNLVYKDLQIQPYLTSKLFNNEERNLLYSLRSMCHPAKQNFRKMNRNNLLCSFGCLQTEDQFHMFIQCPYLKLPNQPSSYDNIFKDLEEQKEAIQVFLPKEKLRRQLIDNFPPGGSRTRADQAASVSISA